MPSRERAPFVSLTALLTLRHPGLDDPRRSSRRAAYSTVAQSRTPMPSCGPTPPSSCSRGPNRSETRSSLHTPAASSRWNSSPLSPSTSVPPPVASPTHSSTRAVHASMPSTPASGSSEDTCDERRGRPAAFAGSLIARASSRAGGPGSPGPTALGTLQASRSRTRGRSRAWPRSPRGVAARSGSSPVGTRRLG